MSLQKLLDGNRAWASEMLSQDRQYFSRLAQQQTPQYLWIGCSDSRVPANQITGLAPGEVFVHRNIANVVVHTDLNCLSVIQFAVDILKVRHIILCGHYGCGGVHAAMTKHRIGLSDNWLRHVQDVAAKHAPELEGLAEVPRHRRLCEVNVAEPDLPRLAQNCMLDDWTYSNPRPIQGAQEIVPILESVY